MKVILSSLPALNFQSWHQPNRNCWQMIRLRLQAEERVPLVLGLVLKLLVLPALAIPLSMAFGLHGPMFQVNVLESAMPTMITAAALAISHQLAPRLAAALVGYSIVIALATLPAWTWVAARLAG